jgi:hypothetical protein
MKNKIQNKKMKKFNILAQPQADITAFELFHILRVKEKLQLGNFDIEEEYEKCPDEIKRHLVKIELDESPEGIWSSLKQGFVKLFQ